LPVGSGLVFVSPLFLQDDFLICQEKEILSPLKSKCALGCLPPWLHREMFFKHTAPESLKPGPCIGSFSPDKAVWKYLRCRWMATAQVESDV
jgi:hypothetical protein